MIYIDMNTDMNHQELETEAIREFLRATGRLKRGQGVTDTGAPIAVPVGPEMLGRIVNVLGEPIDEQGDIGNKMTLPLHSEPPAFTDQSTKAEVTPPSTLALDLCCCRS